MKVIYFLIISFIGFSAHARDLDMFCLNGPVDSVCVIMNDAGLEWQTEFVFDDQGNLIEIDGEEFVCQRDDKGRIKFISLEDAVEDDEDKFITIDMELIYDDSNRVVKVISKSADETWSQNYRYDSAGNLAERDYDTSSDDELLTYTYLETDSHGNWTSRLEKLKSMDQTISQVRHITYR